MTDLVMYCFNGTCNDLTELFNLKHRQVNLGFNGSFFFLGGGMDLKLFLHEIAL